MLVHRLWRPLGKTGQRWEHRLAPAPLRLFEHCSLPLRATRRQRLPDSTRPRETWTMRPFGTWSGKTGRATLTVVRAADKQFSTTRRNYFRPRPSFDPTGPLAVPLQTPRPASYWRAVMIHGPGRVTLDTPRQPLSAARCQFPESHREQAHVPAEQPPPRADARVPAAYAHSCRPRDSVCSPTQGPPSSVRLIAATSIATSMLPAAVRMRHRREFDHAVRAGRRGSAAALVLHLARDPDAHVPAQPRVGFVVGRGVGPSVVRNRVRRQLRHVVGARLIRISADAPGASVVVRATPRAAGVGSTELAQDFDRALAAVLSRGSRR